MVFDFRNLLSLSLFGRKDESIHRRTQFCVYRRKEGLQRREQDGKSASTECVACVAKKKCREKRGQKQVLMI